MLTTGGLCKLRDHKIMRRRCEITDVKKTIFEKSFKRFKLSIVFQIQLKTVNWNGRLCMADRLKGANLPNDSNNRVIKETMHTKCIIK